ncbi:MAG: crossover junction endodeoxyribonuclease RuvC [Candidatus Zeuxoniibacter abyssi]|nr:MAG: crossover junction endodeoxyribonuclease RuvC [Candidatus Persebacteraceae bacterium AB1(2)]
MLILGIDPGLANTGWGVIEVDKAQKRHSANGVIHTFSREAHVFRLRRIAEELGEVIRHWQPSLACVERVFSNVNAKTSLSVGEARGVILATLFAGKIEVTEFSALQIKQSITGIGRADKKRVAAMVAQILDMDVSNIGADATDALACALTATPMMRLSGEVRPSFPYRLRRTRRRRAS